jgi:hypothetical protein
MCYVSAYFQREILQNIYPQPNSICTIFGLQGQHAPSPSPKSQLGPAIGGVGRGGGEEAADGCDLVLADGAADNQRRGGGGGRRKRRKWIWCAALNPSLPLIYVVHRPRWVITTPAFVMWVGLQHLIGPHFGPKRKNEMRCGMGYLLEMLLQGTSPCCISGCAGISAGISGRRIQTYMKNVFFCSFGSSPGHKNLSVSVWVGECP